MTILRMFAFQPADPESAAPAPPEAAKAGEVREATPGGGASPAPETTAPAPQAPGAPQTLSAATWPRVLQSLDLNGSVKAVAGMLAVGEADDARVEFLIGRDDLMLVTDRFRASLARALQAYSGCERRVDFKPVDDDADLPTPARLDNDQRARAQADAETAVAEDPVVKRMQEKFDAEVVPGSVRPAKPAD